jgi:uncharacterized protein YjdB
LKNKQFRLIFNCLAAGIIFTSLMIMTACSPKTTASTATTTGTSTGSPTTGAPSSLTPLITVSYIIIMPATQSLIAVGATKQYTATAAYTDGTSVDITAKANWTCSDNTIATVSAGLVTGVAIGNASIQASLSGVTSGTVSFYIKPPGPDLNSISVSRTIIANLKTGETLQLKATGNFADYTTSDLTTTVTWTSSDNKIATVSATGLVTAVAPGKTTISATYLNVTSVGIVLTIDSP